MLESTRITFITLLTSPGAPAARVLRAIRDGRVARWLRPLWNPRTFGARVEIAQEWMDRNGVAALLPCDWALHALPRALQPEACRLLDEASAMDVDWWQALETKAAAAALALQGSHAAAAMEGRAQDPRTTPESTTCEPWCADEPCGALTGEPVSIRQECGGCSATLHRPRGCWPGAADFPPAEGS